MKSKTENIIIEYQDYNFLNKLSESIDFYNEKRKNGIINKDEKEAEFCTGVMLGLQIAISDFKKHN